MGPTIKQQTAAAGLSCAELSLDTSLEMVNLPLSEKASILATDIQGENIVHWAVGRIADEITIANVSLSNLGRRVIWDVIYINLNQQYLPWLLSRGQVKRF